ncbi:MAG: GAF domain-containing protein [Prevotella sp.]|nr:GAF domain-containing protein [Prevotella sp.]
MMKKEDQYALLVEQVSALIQGETDETAVLSNVSAALHDAFPERFFWVGFYRVCGGELLLGPFQGPVACYHIGLGKGVCGTSWQRRETLIVPDVEQFPGHIACSSLSRSEIVVPIFGADGEVKGVIDIDSRDLNAFDKTDQNYLEKIAAVVARQLNL